MVTRSGCIFALMLALLVFCGCAEDGSLILDAADDPDPLDPGVLPTLASIQARIITPTCATLGCHDTTPGNPMPMRNENETYASLVDYAFPSWNCGGPGNPVQRVLPSDPDNSCLMWKIEGGGPFGGDPMPPPGHGTLSQAEVDAIRQWIEDGALR